MPFFGVPIRNGLPIGLGSSAGFGVQPFDPSYLFAAGEQGFFYDPSDLSTLFQDSAGTTPVTGVEQVVGLMLDKSGNANNATSTGAARPTLSARVNLLTKTEQFDDGAWTKSGFNAFGSGSVANTTATTDPLGGNTADYIQENASGTAHQVFSTGGIAVGAGTYRGFVYAKAAERSRLVMGIWNGSTNYELCQFDLANGVILQEATPGIASIESAGNGWWKCSVSRTIGAVTTFLSFGPHTNTNISTLTGPWSNANYTGNGTSGIYIWGADLRATNDGVGIPAYQRVNTATDYDSSGFPLYLRFGGTQAMSTGSIDFTATDKMSVFAGVRKLSDAAAGMLTELSANYNTNIGSFVVVAPDAAANYSFGLNGTFNTALIATTFASPITNVLSCGLDIAEPTRATEIKPRVNASIPTLTGVGNASAGTGNFGNYPLYIGARNLASLFLNGRIYSLIGVGSAVSAGNISATESWVNGRTKAF